MIIPLYKRDIEIEWDGRFFAKDWEFVANWIRWSITILGIKVSWIKYWDRPINVLTIRKNVTIKGDQK